MALKVYNTLTRKKEIFKPRKDKNVNFFCCGITPYDFAHIGHAKTYVQVDVIVKYLRYSGYDVFYLQNVTDIDDKIIQRAKEKNQKPMELVRNYEKEYLKDMEALSINSVNKFARATEHIKEIIKQVKTLMDRGFAYIIENDGIYFDLSKFPEYGKLSGRKTEEAEDAVTRIDESVNKRNKGDFCLWKKSKKDEPSWKDPWFNNGRPGWHIEDTAISEKYFGKQYDVHGGARDLIFPHHEAEIAQMEAASGKKPFVKYWLHTGFLNVKGQKMAKSLGNFITIRDDLKLIEKAKKEFIKCMDDDFDTVKALAVIFDFIREANKKGAGKKSYELMLEFDKLFNVLTLEETELSPEIKKLIDEREKARKEKDFGKADKIRQELRKKGIVLEDTKEGVRWKKA